MTLAELGIAGALKTGCSNVVSDDATTFDGPKVLTGSTLAVRLVDARSEFGTMKVDRDAGHHVLLRPLFGVSVVHLVNLRSIVECKVTIGVANRKIRR